MHILLTNILSCPRCGPEFGLVLLADRVEDRRVVEGRLGCPNCREQYPVARGVLDARLPADRPAPPPAAAGTESPEAALPGDDTPSPDAAHPGGEAADAATDPAAETGAEAAVRLAALLGLADARGTALVAGPGAALAAEVAALVPELEVVALATDAGTGGATSRGEQPGVSHLLAGGTLPFRSRTLRGVALTGGGDEATLAEAVRVLQPGARLVVQRAGPATAETLARLGARVMLAQEGTVVATAAGDPVQLRMNAVR